MPRKDIFHEVVKSALLLDGWVITDDPLFVPTKGRFKKSQYGKSKKIRGFIKIFFESNTP